MPPLCFGRKKLTVRCRSKLASCLACLKSRLCWTECLLWLRWAMMRSISEIPSLGLQGFKGRSLVSCAALGLVLCNVLSPCSSGFSPHSCSSMTAEGFQLWLHQVAAGALDPLCGRLGDVGGMERCWYSLHCMGLAPPQPVPNVTAFLCLGSVFVVWLCTTQHHCLAELQRCWEVWKP